MSEPELSATGGSLQDRWVCRRVNTQTAVLPLPQKINVFLLCMLIPIMRTYKYHATYCITWSVCWYAASQFTCLGLPPKRYQEHGQHCAQRSPPDDMSDDIVTPFSSSARKQVRRRFGKLAETFWVSLALALSLSLARSLSLALMKNL